MKNKKYSKSVKLRIAAITILFGISWSLMGTSKAHAGTLWTEKEDTLPNGFWREIKSSASGNDLVGIYYSYDTSLYYVERSNDAGDSWVDITPNDPDIPDENEFGLFNVDNHYWTDIEISADGSNIILSDESFQNNHNYVWYSPNHGINWEILNGEGQPGNGYWSSVSVGNNGQDLAVSSAIDNEIGVSTDYGNTWNMSAAPTVSPWSQIVFSPDGNFLVAEEYATHKMYVSGNQGANWTDVNGPDFYLSDMDIANNGTIIAAAGYNTAFVGKIVGESYEWTDTTLGGDQNMNVSISTDGTKLAAVRRGGDIYLANSDDVTAWSEQSGPGQPGNPGFWEGITINADGSQIAAAGYNTNVWVSQEVDFPEVVSVTPIDGATKVSTSSKIVITFSEAMDPETVEINTDPCGADCPIYSQAWTNMGTVLTLTKTNGKFKPNTQYSIAVSGNNQSEVAMPTEFDWSFTTAKNFEQGGSIAGSQQNQNSSTPPTTTPTNPSTPLCADNIFLTKPVKLGTANNPDDVKLLQNFLNSYEGGNLAVDGVYKKIDFDAVMAWQEKYAADILAPWGLHKGTGFVSTTSLKKIKQIVEASCTTHGNQPAQQQQGNSDPGLNIKQITKDLHFGMIDDAVKILQEFLISQAKGPASEVLKNHGSSTSFGPLTKAALAEWQKANGITPASGNFGPKTRAFIAAM